MTLRSCTQCGRPIPTGTRCHLHPNTIRYDNTHRARRKALLPYAIGQTCTLCGNTMHKGQTLDLDHTTDTITHATCNRREGAAITNAGGRHTTQTPAQRATLRGFPRATGRLLA